MKTIFVYLLLISLTWNLLGCGAEHASQVVSENGWKFNPPNSAVRLLEKTTSKYTSGGNLSESEPPQTIQELNQNFEKFYPQVAILSPTSDEIFDDATIQVKLQVKNFPIFKDEQLAMGPHLNLIVDNEPNRSIYDLNEPIVLENLAPGTHTIRVFAARPWGESFKNQEAYAQTSFHILTKTNNNRPDPTLPLLTYSLPTGKYSAEPILLDFYLTNAPLHLIAQENPNDEIKDWQIRVTVNGESFLLDQWQPIYLQGFKRGNNWVQLELIDENGNNIENAFNNTVRLVTYDPSQPNTLAKLVQGKISAIEARGIVEQGYQAKLNQIPEVKETIVPETKSYQEQLEAETESETVEPLEETESTSAVEVN
ncbi:MAG: hypothetical protein Kow0049_16290 [Stanieria sp.]